MNTKTYRVPKRVREQAHYGLTEIERLDAVPPEALQVATFLSSAQPIGPAVLRAMNRYFMDNLRKPLTTPVAKMYGGRAGKEWAARCVGGQDARVIVAGGEPPPGWDPTDDQIEAMIAFSKEMSDLERQAQRQSSGTTPPGTFTAGNRAPKELATTIPDWSVLDNYVDTQPPAQTWDIEAPLVAGVGAIEDDADAVESPTEEAPEPEVVEEEPEEDFDQMMEALQEQVDAALGLATQLDDTIDKLSETMESAVDQLTGGMSEEEYEKELALAALAEWEVEKRVEEQETVELTNSAKAAQERMAQAALVRERSLAMARMASKRVMTLAAEGAPGADVAPAPDQAGGVGPKGPGGQHHSKTQVRDYHGRFAKTGSRVESQSGKLGWISGVNDDGSVQVQTDDGQEVKADPKTMKVVNKTGRAKLSEPPQVVEDPSARLDAYEEWANAEIAKVQQPPAAEPLAPPPPEEEKPEEASMRRLVKTW